MMLVEYTCEDHVVTLTLNRPEKLNAFSDELVVALNDGLRRFDADPEAFVAIITGRGRAFSSGADVQQRQLRSREEFQRLGGPQGFGANSGDLLTKSVNWKPVIAAPHGYVLGLAVGIVLESDLIVAEAGTKFQITETPRGLGGAKYWALMQFRGASAFGTEVALTGRFFTAEEALAAGLINRVARTWTPHASWPAPCARTRPSACAPPSARAAGTWISSRARSRCRPPRSSSTSARTSRKRPAPSRKSASPARSKVSKLTWGDAWA
jgi:enoyl-CoA hydratase/carnithine racemase